MRDGCMQRLARGGVSGAALRFQLAKREPNRIYVIELQRQYPFLKATDPAEKEKPGVCPNKKLGGGVGGYCPGR